MPDALAAVISEWRVIAPMANTVATTLRRQHHEH